MQQEKESESGRHTYRVLAIYANGLHSESDEVRVEGAGIVTAEAAELTDSADLKLLPKGVYILRNGKETLKIVK